MGRAVRIVGFLFSFLGLSSGRVERSNLVEVSYPVFPDGSYRFSSHAFDGAVGSEIAIGTPVGWAKERGTITAVDVSRDGTQATITVAMRYPLAVLSTMGPPIVPSED